MTTEAEKDLARSGVTPEEAEKAGLYEVNDASEVNRAYAAVPGLVIPYFDPRTGEPMLAGSEPFSRLRYLADASPKGFKKTKPQRYVQPPGSPVRAYFPRTDAFAWPDVLDDPDTPLVVTEGEKKALKACLCEVPTIGLGGVYNFMQNDALLSELADVTWKGRDVYICYDSDAALNPDIQSAEARLATEIGLKRGARVFICRLPPGKAAGNEKAPKVGLDDFIVEKGVDAWIALLQSAPRMRRIDAAVMSLNGQVAWVENDGMVYDIGKNTWLQKHNFVNGSSYSALTIEVPNPKGTGVKRASVAGEWLTHPLALRYDAVTFDPSTEAREVVTDKGLRALNMWRGFETEDGDASPWFELSERLFSELPEDLRGFAVDLATYKAQNPGVKVPIAPVLVGTQGGGKSLWARCLREAFAPYGVAVPSKALLSEFNPWVESSLIAVIDEAQAVHLTKGADVLKGLISEQRTYFNDKYRQARQVDSYTMYILTSNERRVGGYSADDRRMFVVNTPAAAEPELYDRVGGWLKDGGAKRLMRALLERDLGGWAPPKKAPLTAEKYMAYMESLTPIQRLAEEMQTATQNTIKLWIDAALQWATVAQSSESMNRSAREIIDSLPHIQIRPFYTPEELAMMFPALAYQLHGQTKAPVTTTGDLSRQLREAGVTYLRCSDNPRGFVWQGVERRFLIVASPEDWREPLTQKEFERVMRQFPRYSELETKR